MHGGCNYNLSELRIKTHFLQKLYWKYFQSCCYGIEIQAMVIQVLTLAALI